MNETLTQGIILLMFWTITIAALVNGDVLIIVVSLFAFCINLLFMIFYYDLFY